MTITETIKSILKEAADAHMNMQSEVARAVLAEKIMIEVGNWVLSTTHFEEQNNG